MTDTPDFDAADLADAILGLDDAPTPASSLCASATHSGRGTGSALGWVLVVSLIVAVCIAISLAVQLGPETSSPPDPPCGGLYDTCEPAPCDDVHPLEEDNRRGLFDSEERFVDRPSSARC